MWSASRFFEFFRSAPRCSPQLQRQKHEYLYAALHERFKTMIHCARSSHYLCLPDMAKIMTTDPGNARIFACFKKEVSGNVVALTFE